MTSSTRVRHGVLALTVLGLAAGVVAPVGTAAADPSNACSYFADCNSVGGHISRQTVAQRASVWLQADYAYSQTTHVNGTGENTANHWRTDCSGFISMAWRLPGQSPNYGLNTTSLKSVATQIPFASLRRGDILDDTTSSDAHVVLFDGWVGATGGDYWIIEENGVYNMIRRKASSTQEIPNGHYVPFRYDKITDN